MKKQTLQQYLDKKCGGSKSELARRLVNRKTGAPMFVQNIRKMNLDEYYIENGVIMKMKASQYELVE